jgi:PAS domain S-box-containing protein
MAGTDTETVSLRSQVKTLEQLLEIHDQQAHTFVGQIRQQQGEIEERTRQVSTVNDKLEAAVSFLADIHKAMPCGLIVVDPRTGIESVNDSLLALLGHVREDLVGATLATVFAPDDAPTSAEIEMLAANEHALRIEKNCVTKDGEVVPVLFSARHLACRAGAGRPGGAVCIVVDIRDLKRLEIELRQAQKLESVGQLAAGIAHEINTPVQYVGDNTRFIQQSFRTIQETFVLYAELLRAFRADAVTPELVAHVEQVAAAGDFEYLFREIPEAIEQSLEGVDRITRIVRAMKEFSHPGTKDKAAADLNRAIESTVTVARSAWKLVADVRLDLDPQLPPVICFLGDINQAVLNLIVNAAHAVGDAVKEAPGAKGLITIATRLDGDHVEVRVSDTGAGIPAGIRPRLFEPFFTTKGVGKGTGQGLSVVYGAIVSRHGGTVTFSSEEGSGTTFVLRLPIADSRPDGSACPAERDRRELVGAAPLVGL